MYTLIVNGSPRPNGDTAALIRAFCGELPGEWEILNVRDGKTAPCLDCRRFYSILNGLSHRYRRRYNSVFHTYLKAVFFHFKR